MKELTANNVEEVIKDSLFRAGEDISKHVAVSGVVSTFGFHPGRLASHKAEIKEMLSQLPEQFHAGTGDGWSFLQACMTRTGQQWGEHRNIDALLCLGIATKQARILFPRSMWNAFPGGVPYFVVGEQADEMCLKEKQGEPP